MTMLRKVQLAEIYRKSEKKHKEIEENTTILYPEFTCLYSTS